MPSHIWHSWSEQRKKIKSLSFINIPPLWLILLLSLLTLVVNQDIKGNRETCLNQIVDRSEQIEYDENPITSEENARDSADLSFCDPREREGKVYELHVRSKLPKSVSKCQGKCGGPIKDEDIMVIRSYRKVSWTDKATGKEKQRFGPMYLHFKEDW